MNETLASILEIVDAKAQENNATSNMYRAIWLEMIVKQLLLVEGVDDKLKGMLEYLKTCSK